MSSAIEWVLIDCVDLDAMTDFWCQALDLEHVGTGPSGGHILEAADGSGRKLGLMPSAGPKAGKNRVHSISAPTIKKRRCAGWSGSVPAARRRRAAGVRWVVMADPEGNEFCVLRSLAQKAADRAQLGG